MRAAAEIADRQGIEAVTMRSVATALTAGAMSLYRYVRGKDDLLDLILDAAFGEIELSADGANWSVWLREAALESRRVIKLHPWMPALMIARPTLGPNYLRWFEYLLQATANSKWSMRRRMQLIGTVWAYVTGFVAYELGEAENNRRHDLSEADKRRAAAPYVERLLATGAYPNLAEFLKLENAPPGDADFEAGLQAILAGFANERRPRTGMIGRKASP